MFGGVLSRILTNIPRIYVNSLRLLHPTGEPGPYSQLPVKKKTRYNLPRPKETKRIGMFGWDKRMSTLHGRKIIMRRILTGKYNLAH